MSSICAPLVVLLVVYVSTLGVMVPFTALSLYVWRRANETGRLPPAWVRENNIAYRRNPSGSWGAKGPKLTNASRMLAWHWAFTPVFNTAAVATGAVVLTGLALHWAYVRMFFGTEEKHKRWLNA